MKKVSIATMKAVVRYCWIAAAALLTLACDPSRALGDDARLTWSFTNNPSALCNDFTRAGFFHRPPSEATGEGRWVVFLESGSFCYSNETCNRRYFQRRVRNMYNDRGRRSANGGQGDFDTSYAWRESGGKAAASSANKNQLVEIVNPLMTSMSCFNNTKAFQDSFTLQGRDVLDRNLEESNFRSHGHVVIPYCSSDVWLGSETERSRNYSQRNSSGDREDCDCWDTSCFTYDPKHTGLQFTFRGKIIFQSAIRTLHEMYNLQGSGAKEIILMGSSAGGLGVLNLAKWVRDEYPNLEVKAVVDSSWFINFRDGIKNQFSLLHLKNTIVDEEKPSPSSAPPSTPSSPSLPVPSTTSDFPPSSSLMPSSHLTPSPTSLPHEGSESGSESGSGSGEGSGSGSESGANSEEDGNYKRSPTLEEIVNEMNSREKREEDSASEQGTNSDLSRIDLDESCYDARQGFPCCLSAQCLLSESSPTTKEPYFPNDIPLFVITSLYDIFILAPSITNIRHFQSDSTHNTAGLALEFLTTIGEYGGAMNSSVQDIENMQRANFSYYASQCFQHIYLASSSLWGEDSLFGTAPMIVERTVATFR